MTERVRDISKFDAWLDECVDELISRNASVIERFDLESYERWDMSQEAGQLVFSNGGSPLLVADAQFIGSYSTKSETWMWGWANSSILPHFSQDIVNVKNYGESFGYAELIEIGFPCDEEMAWALSAAAVVILDGEAVYRAPDETSMSFLLMRNVRPV